MNVITFDYFQKHPKNHHNIMDYRNTIMLLPYTLLRIHNVVLYP